MDEHETPIMFRMSEGECTAVLVCEPADIYGQYLTCYAHIGQHGSCSWHWVMSKTTPATAEQYISLLRELSSEPYGYRVKIVKRRTNKHRDVFNSEVSRLLSMRRA